ncbi:sugar-binding transcriptional regulator [Verrucomicrobiota bacterium sgz303538]
MTQHNYSDEQLRLAARLYYIDGLGQIEVARFAKVSQAKVSRLLALARERGIVRISVAEYEPRDHALEEQIRKTFGLDAVAAIKTTDSAATENTRLMVGHFGAPFVASLIPAGSVVAIAGGRAIRELVQVLPEDQGRRLTVVQAMGSIDSSVGPVDAMELGRTIAARSGGSFLMLNTPAFVPDKKTRDAFHALDQVSSVFRCLGEAQVALVGIGTLENSVFVERGILSAADLVKLKERGAVGEICGRFFDKDGQECVLPWRDRVMSISLEQLRNVPQVVGVVAGNDRSAAIAAAIRGGLLKSLVIDAGGAAALLAGSQAQTVSPNGKVKGNRK